ncbi:MAG TPA: UvrD-helicase domain-containing protein, partial [Chitinophagaceae bacterium]|nr:UvrD-helicase domain-containing protein [Chitinophagaceae bacterium]
MTLTISIIAIVMLMAFLVYRQALEKKKYIDSTYLTNLQKIISFFDTIQNLDDYVTWVYRDQIKSTYSAVGKFFKNKTNFYKKEETVKQFNEIFSDFDNYIAQYNQNYVRTQKEKLNQYFDDVEGKELDNQQRTALITDEYSNLILAGAGSGKTLTIIGKVKYLIEQKNVKPENILLLSFTKKTVEELNERLKNIGLEAKATTFHKLGYDTIKQNLANIPTLTNENTLGNIVRNYLEKDIFDNSEALEAYIVYVACYMNIPEEHENFGSLGEKMDIEKGIDFQTLKSKCEPEELNKVKKAQLDTIQGEKVKSVEELTIANFLYLNGIDYEYEKAY